MTPRTPHATPSWRATAKAHFRAIGIALRPTLSVAGALGVALAVMAGLAALRDGEGIAFVPNYSLLVALAACLLPIAVWRGEHHARRSYLASLPVDRARHVLTKVAAGWAWLLALTALFTLGMIALAATTGGAIGIDEMRVMQRDLPLGGSPADVAALARRWTTPGWHWAVFFTSTTVSYLLGSAVVLAGGRVRRWLGGLAVLAVFLVLVAEQGYHFGSVGVWLVEGLETVLVGPYGVVALFALTDNRLVTTPTGEELWAWGDPPSVGAWTLATLLWTGLALAAVLLAVGRDRSA